MLTPTPTLDLWSEPTTRDADRETLRRGEREWSTFVAGATTALVTQTEDPVYVGHLLRLKDRGLRRLRLSARHPGASTGKPPADDPRYAGF